MKRAICLSTALLLIPSALHAKVIQFPLSGLLGEYSDPSSNRSVSLDLTGLSGEVLSAYFLVSGTATVGEYAGGDLCSPGPWCVQLHSTLGESEPGGWYASAAMPSVPGTFQWTAMFEYLSGDETDLDFLHGQATVTLVGGPSGMPMGCSPTTSPPRALVEEAVLILGGDLTIQTSSSTWGRIKAMFR